MQPQRIKTTFYKILLYSFTIAALLLTVEGYGQGYIQKSKRINNFSYTSYNLKSKVVRNGETYLTGIDYDSISFITRLKLTKLNNNGDVIWERIIGGSVAIGGASVISEGLNLEFHNGSLYIIGYTQSSDFPVTNGSVFDTTRRNTFYMKVNATTGATQFSTFANEVEGYLSLMKFNGDFTYLMSTSGQVPLLCSAVSYLDYIPAKIVINKYNNISNSLVNTFTIDSCFFSTSNNDKPWRMGGDNIEVNDNHIFVAAKTASSHFSVTNGSVLKGSVDMVYVKLNATTGTVEFASYYGGDNGVETIPNYCDPSVTWPSKIKKDNGKIYISGNTEASDFNFTNGNTWSNTFTGGFLMCLDATTNTLIFNRPYVGIFDVQDGIIYSFNAKAGRSNFTNIPQYDLVFEKLNGGTGETISTVDFTSTTDDEFPIAMYIDNGEAYLFGGTAINPFYTKVLPSGFPITNGITTYNDNNSYTVTKVSTDNNICYSTYLGSFNDYYFGYRWDYYYRRNFDPISSYDNNIYINLNINGSHYESNFSYPLTQIDTFTNYSNRFFTRINLNPQMPQGIDSLIPGTQTACKNGFANLITGQEIIIPSSLMPTLYTNGVASLQPPVLLKYQWQKSDNPTGPWSNISGANDINYFPEQLGVINQYYRRQAYASICAPSNILSTSSVSAVLLNSNTAPLINANSILYNCPNTTIQLGGTPTATALGGAAITGYLWGPTSETFAPNATVSNPTVTPSNSKVYSLQVLDNNGCKQIWYQSVNVYAANAGLDKSSCSGNIVRIGSPAIQGLSAISYNWTASPADQTMSCTTCAQPDVHPLVNTNYILKMTVALQAGGTCTTTDTVLVKVASAPLPAAFGGPDKTVCVSSTITLGNLPQSGFTYNWLLTPSYTYGSFLDNPTASNPTFYYNSVISPSNNPLTYIVKATKVGCVYQDTVKVFLLGASAGEDGCGPRLLGFPDPTPAIPKTFLWTVVNGQGNILGANNTPQISVGAAVGGNVTYRLTVTMNGITCTDDVIVFATCGGAGSSPNGCQYPVIQVVAPNACANYSTNGGNVKLVAKRTIPSTYTWSPAAGLSNTVGDTVSLTDNVPRTYTVTAKSTIDTTNSCTSSIAVNNPVIIPVFSAQHILTCPGVPVTIGQPSVSGYTYLWEDPLGNSLNSTTISNPTATVSSTIYYPVQVKSNTGCIVRDTASVTVVSFDQNNAGEDVLLCDTNVAQLGMASNPIFTYSWTGAATFVPNNTVANPTVIVNTTTTFALVVTNTATGCTVTDSVTVTVSPPIPAFSFANVNYCQSSGAIALPQGPLGMASYSWTPSNLVLNAMSNGPVATTLNNPPYTPTTYSLTVTNSGGCTKLASVLFTPTATNPVAGNSRTICKNASTQIGATVQSGSYSWSQTPSTGGTLNFTNISNPTFTGTALGTYKLIVSKTTNGCTTKDSLNINVTEVALPPIPDPVLCQNSCLPIGFTSTTGTQYSWNPTFGLSNPNISNPIVCLNTNSQLYTLHAVSVNGCTASRNIIVTVNPSPSHTITVAPIAACVGTTGLSLNPVISPAGSYNYLWNSSNGLSNIYAPNPVVSLTTLGTKNYNVVVTNNSTGCATTASTTVTANTCTPPIKLVSFTAAPQDKTVLLSWVVSEEINVLKYEIEFSTDGRNFWPIGTKAATNSASYNLVHNSPVLGINYYRLKMIDRDGKISYSDIRTVNFKLAGSLTIYPNPANNLLYITFAAGSINKTATISVIAMDGKLMYQKNINRLSQTEMLDVSKLANGCYIIRILTNKEIINKSVVVYR